MFGAKYIEDQIRDEIKQYEEKMKQNKIECALGIENDTKKWNNWLELRQKSHLQSIEEKEKKLLQVDKLADLKNKKFVEEVESVIKNLKRSAPEIEWHYCSCDSFKKEDEIPIYMKHFFSGREWRFGERTYGFEIKKNDEEKAAYKPRPKKEKKLKKQKI
jgi:nucleotidyltransferase/DNA polymerase involved in DNA repair